MVQKCKIYIRDEIIFVSGTKMHLQSEMGWRTNNKIIIIYMSWMTSQKYSQNENEQCSLPITTFRLSQLSWPLIGTEIYWSISFTLFARSTIFLLVKNTLIVRAGSPQHTRNNAPKTLAHINRSRLLKQIAHVCGYFQFIKTLQIWF